MLPKLTMCKMNLLVQLKKPLTSRRGIRFEAEGGSVSLDHLRVTLNRAPDINWPTRSFSHGEHVDDLFLYVETRGIVFRLPSKDAKIEIGWGD